jgi:hypothetical protein
MARAVASTPQVLVGTMQQAVEALPKAIIGHFGAGGGGGVQTPESTTPHTASAWSEQQTGGGVISAGLGWSGGQVLVPHVTLAAATPPLPAAAVPAVPVA